MPECIFPGDSEMARRISALDWSKTPLGPAETWSPALRMMTRFLLANRFPLLLWWGPQYVSIYNDAYWPVLGTKHPWALGQPVSECWKEIWHILQPLIDTPFRGGPATWNDDILLEINRHGFVEETHFTIAYSPVPDETVPSGIGGVLATVHEITGKVVGDRRVVVLRDLGARPAQGKTAEEACAIAAETLAAHAKDIPFALLYLIDPDRKSARLAGTAGVRAGERASPAIVFLDDYEASASPWPLAEAMRSEEIQTVTDLANELDGQVPSGPWTDPPHSAVVVPIPSNKVHYLAGFLVAGVSARLQLEDSYRDFLKLVSSHIATSIANARVYEEEKKRIEALAEIDRAKTAFFSNVSHEFRTPLTLMLNPIEELLAHSHTELSPAAKGQLEVAHRNSLRLLRLVNTLLDFSRIEAGRAQAVFEPTDLAAFTVELASVFRAATERAGLKLTVDCPPLSEPVYVDRAMWEKIVLNLVSNAFKFTFEGEIVVSLRTEGEAAELRVRDTGVGIPAEEMPRLFERFYRLPNMRSRTHEGSGIGLALVQELVKLHGGLVHVESRPGDGSTFIVSLPLGSTHLPQEKIGGSFTLVSTSAVTAPFVEEALRWLPHGASAGDSELPPREEFPPAPYPAGDADESRPRLLIADDNADMRQYLARLLAKRYDVRTVPDGQEALAAVRERRPDLILCDVMMPRLDGIGLLRELRADADLGTIPFIFLSARAGEEARVEGLQKGADDYLIKPFSAHELLARVAAHLDLARLRKRAQEALRESEARLQAVLDGSPDPIFLKDREGRLLLANPATFAVIGKPSESCLGKTDEQFFDNPADGRAIMANDRRIMTSGRSEIVEETISTPSGPRYYVSNKAPYRDAAGNIIGLIGTARDVTERKQAEEALRESEARFRHLFEDNVAALLVIDPDRGGAILDANPAAVAFYGWSRDELRGRCISEINVLSRAEVAAVMARARSGDQRQFEFRHRLKDGSIRDVDVYSGPVPFEERTVLYSIIHDVTGRRQAEAALRESEERFRGIFENAGTGIAITDLDGRFQLCNPAYVSMLGFTEEELRGLVFPDLVHPDDREAKIVAIRQLLSETIPSIEVLNRSVRKDGAPIWVHKRISLLRDAAGQPSQIIALVTDMTDRKRSEEHIQLLMREVNHRSKNLLGLIQAIARQTAATSPDDFIARFSERLQSLAQAQDLLIENEWKAVPIADLVRTQLSHFGDLIGGRISIAGPPLSLTPAASQSLGMVVHELATNAAKHGALSSESGSIAIAWNVGADESTEPQFTMSWIEAGGPTVHEPDRSGFGSTVISRMVEISVGGKVSLEYAPTGFVWRLACPARNIVEARFVQFAVQTPAA